MLLSEFLDGPSEVCGLDVIEEFIHCEVGLFRQTFCGEEARKAKAECLEKKRKERTKRSASPWPFLSPIELAFRVLQKAIRKEQGKE